jgi:YggT family protein
MNPGLQALQLIVQFAFDLYILAVLLRLVLQWVRADFYNPVSQFIVKVTQPVVVPVRRFVPGLAGIDLATIIILFALVLSETVILRIILNWPISLGGLLVTSLAMLLGKIWWIFVICIFIQVIMSWINPMGYTPAMSLVNSITAPVLRPAQRLIPPVGGFDLSPLLVLLVFQLFDILVIKQIEYYAALLSAPGRLF